MRARLGSVPLIQARLVDESDRSDVDHSGATSAVAGEAVFVATRVRFWDRKGKSLAACACFALLLAAALPSAILVRRDRAHDSPAVSGSSPSAPPSAAPTYDPRPTLEVVRARGKVRCGLGEGELTSRDNMKYDMCRSVAAVVLGDPDNVEGVHVRPDNRFEKLRDRELDVLIMGDTHTLEREVRERTTGEGFAFFSPYYYDGLAYLGNETFVKCAERRKRYGECAALSICTIKGSTHLERLRRLFPSDFLEVGTSLEQTMEMLSIGTCNAFAMDHSALLDVSRQERMIERGSVVGEVITADDPLAMVTRKGDREFSDAVNWVLQALFYGEDQGLTKDPTLCQNFTSLSQASDLDFINAVYCVGNYAEILGDHYGDYHRMNEINNGTTGMIYATPLGTVYDTDDDMSISGTTLERIRRQGDTDCGGCGNFRCGVIVPRDFDGNITESDGSVGMSVTYCQSVAAALFNGFYEDISWFTYSEDDDSAFRALDDRTIDVLAGGRIEKKHDLKSPFRSGFHFSSPYFFGDELAHDDIGFFSLMTRDDDDLFSSFINSVVLATIHASKEKGWQPPLMTLFGTEFTWALRDAISFGGDYEQIYKKNFGEFSEEGRGRNALNAGGPQINSFPGLTTRNR